MFFIVEIGFHTPSIIKEVVEHGEVLQNSHEPIRSQKKDILNKKNIMGKPTDLTTLLGDTHTALPLAEELQATSAEREGISLSRQQPCHRSSNP